MRRICAWCNRELSPKEPLDSDLISHTICDDCYQNTVNEPIENQYYLCLKCQTSHHIEDLDDNVLCEKCTGEVWNPEG